MEFDEKLQDKVIAYLCGEDTLPIIHFLKGKYNVSEFDIAKALNLDLNVMRNQLYRLQQQDLLKFKRKKDKQKGWYIYYWTPDLSNLPYLYLKILKNELERVESRLKRERNNFFFSCENHCMRLSFEQAMDFNFICPECGSIMHEVKNDDIIKQLEEKRKDLIKKIDELETKIIPNWKKKQRVAPELELPKKRRSKNNDEEEGNDNTNNFFNQEFPEDKHFLDKAETNSLKNTSKKRGIKFDTNKIKNKSKNKKSKKQSKKSRKSISEKNTHSKKGNKASKKIRNKRTNNKKIKNKK